MHREDNSKYLLYIEPSSALKDEVPITDNITSAMDYMLSNAVQGAARYSDLTDKGTFHPRNGWMGLHTTGCGTHSSPHDYLLPNGMITNSLCVFYVSYYRRAIPKSE